MMKAGENLNGFLVTRVRSSAELSGTLVEMTHEKTGARLVWLDNGLENKTFSIAFRTLPTDNTGVFHILEHSVLCGSEKYPVKEPFVELLKGSMNTFLNAMTFPDMTMYPVSSRNDRDLLNLTEVYLDAVFRPRILQDERLFRQEGWHIEKDENGKYIYKGVVFNEMKGAMSDVSQVGETEIGRQLFPDTGYGFNSGGDPDAIPDLTYEQYRETYLRHYHPSNAWIYLDGAVPLDAILALIASYLDTYEAEEALPRFTLQQPVASSCVKEYELGQEEDPENKGQLYLSRILGSWQDKAMNMAALIIGDVLTGNNDAPLKRLILEKELAQDFSLSVDDSSLQTVLTLHAENVTDGKEEEIIAAVADFARDLEQNGLNRGDVEASLNRLAFTLKEEEEPQGIERAIRIMDSWLYDGDPLFALEFDAQLAQIREMLDSGEMDRLALRLLQDQTGMCRLSLRPSKTLGAETRAKEEARLQRITAAWTEADLAANEALIASLQAWQQTPDSPEDLAKLPMLKKEDADVPPYWPETREASELDVPILFHPQPTAGIYNLRTYLNLADVTLEEAQALSLMCAMLGKLPTAHHDSAALQQDIKRYTGRLSSAVVIRSHPTDPSRCRIWLSSTVSALRENTEKAQQLLAEVLTETDFSDIDRVMEIVYQLEMSSRQRIVGAGHQLALHHVLAGYSAEYAARNAVSGVPAVAWLHTFATEPEKLLPVLQAAAEKLKREIACRRRLTLSLTSEEMISCKTLLQALPEGTPVPEFASFKADPAPCQGYRIPAQVGFSARGYHLSRMDQSFSGALLLVSNILSLSYLWNRVRVQGGAYGCNFHVDRYGNVSTMSYRDPTPDRTLSVDAGASDFLREFLQGGEALDKFIISTLNDLNPLLSPREKGAVADIRYFGNYTLEAAEALRREILNVSREDLERTCAILDAFAEKGAVCVVAPAETLNRCEGFTVSDL